MGVVALARDEETGSSCRMGQHLRGRRRRRPGLMSERPQLLSPVAGLGLRWTKARGVFAGVRKKLRPEMAPSGVISLLNDGFGSLLRQRYGCGWAFEAFAS